MKISKHLIQSEATKNPPVQWRCIIPAVLFSISSYISFMFSNPLYLSTDSIGVAIVVDGYYGDNNFCQYIHPLLCLFIRFLTPLIPTADVFTLLTHIVIGIQIGVLFLLFTDKILVKPIKNWTVYGGGKVLSTSMVILLFTSGITIWNTNYTITTGAIVLFGLTICFVSEKEQKRLSWIIIGASTLCFGCMLRMESALLFFPFIVLEGVIHCLSPVAALPDRGGASNSDGVSSNSAVEVKESGNPVKHMRKFKRSIQSRLLPVVAIIFLLYITRTFFYAQEPYQTAARYNAARTTCVDFPTKPWSPEVEADSDGAFSANDYAAATDWCFMDTDFLDTEMLERIAGVGEKNKYEVNVAGIKGMLSEMKYTLFNSSLYMVLLVILSTVLSIRNIICCGIWRKTETILAILGAFIIILYFTFRGRAPMRVWEPVIFAADFNLLMAALDQGSAQTTSEFLISGWRTSLSQAFGLLIFIILWFSTGQLIANGSLKTPQPIWLSRIPIEYSVYDVTVSDIAGEDALFIWPNWNAHLPQEVKTTGRLPSKEIVRHNIAMGDWVYGQPYFTKFLESINAENPAAALLNRTNTYIMGGQNDLAGHYLQEHAKDLSQKPADRKPEAADGDGIIQFEPVPELGVINDMYANKVKYIYKGGTAGR